MVAAAVGTSSSLPEDGARTRDETSSHKGTLDVDNVVFEVQLMSHKAEMLK